MNIRMVVVISTRLLILTLCLANASYKTFPEKYVYVCAAI